MARELSTEELVRLAQAGDRDALEQLFDRHREPLLARVSRRMKPALRRETEPADIVQETFLWALKSISRFRWRGDGSFAAWLGTIAEHMILKSIDRGGGRPVIRLSKEPLAEEASPSRAMRRDERFDRLRQALDSLSPEHREVIVLARIEGREIQDIAARMGRTPNAVSQLLARALRELRGGFGDTDSLHLPARRLEGEGRGDAAR